VLVEQRSNKAGCHDNPRLGQLLRAEEPHQGAGSAEGCDHVYNCPAGENQGGDGAAAAITP
jgi:hypothetical protein